MKKKRILNLCMVIAVAFTMLCGGMTVASVKGWFQKTEASLQVAEKSGIVVVERKGVSYELSEEDVIRSGDTVSTKAKASVTVAREGTVRLSLNENTRILVEEGNEGLQIFVLQGEVFADTRGWNEEVSFIVNGECINPRNAVFAVSCQQKAATLWVYSGNAGITGTRNMTAEEGKAVYIVEGKEETTVSTEELSLQALSDFQVRWLKKCKIDDNFCFAHDDVNNLEEQRKGELLASQQAQVLEENITENVEGESEETDATFQKEDKQETPAPSVNYCTIEIRCDTILSNMENLEPGKEVYVPSDGFVLAAAKVEFTQGETVFDILKKACQRAGIQLEYSYTPIYDSYYIEGINNLYEFDCGSESGWMFKVNGWFPNYGCSGYTLNDGDVIVWCYTCNGWGADVENR